MINALIVVHKMICSQKMNRAIGRAICFNTYNKLRSMLLEKTKKLKVPVSVTA